MRNLSLFTSALVASLSVGSFAYTISGTVTEVGGGAISGAKVALVKENKAATTDAEGKFTIHEDENTEAIAGAQAPGFISINSGILSYAQGGSAPVQVKIFDAMGNQVFKQTLYGAGQVDLTSGVKARGSYFAQVNVGSAKQMFRFNATGTYTNSFDSEGNALLKEIQPGEQLVVSADGYDTLAVALSTLDTTLNLKLNKTLPSEPTFKFGYALGNKPTPSKGCGVDSKLQSVGQNSNAKKYSMTSAGLNREFWITLPKNYDKTKPYKILFAMHCMGSNAEDFTNHTPDQDHPSPYYGQQNLDKENNYIFVAPRGDTDYMPWRTGDDKDHIFFGELLTLLEENYCIDTSRVFVTGFSFGAMVTNSLAQDYQDRIRAVAVYATADYNIYLPTNKGKPIAWMAVHGKKDGTCDYNRAKNSALKRILKNNGKADANENFTDASAETPTEVGGSGHLCYDFTTVDERFPVKFCSWNGQHQWTAYDNGNWQNTWVPEEVRKFFEQF